jgi:hypothetical protein
MQNGAELDLVGRWMVEVGFHGYTLVRRSSYNNGGHAGGCPCMTSEVAPGGQRRARRQADTARNK